MLRLVVQFDPWKILEIDKGTNLLIIPQPCSHEVNILHPCKAENADDKTFKITGHSHTYTCISVPTGLGWLVKVESNVSAEPHECDFAVCSVL